MKKYLRPCLLFCCLIFATQCNKDVYDPVLPQEGNNLNWNEEWNEKYKEFPGDVWDTTFTESLAPAPLVQHSNTRSFSVYLVVQNHQLYWNDNIPAKIIEANSPETCFAYLDRAWLDWLFSKGVNTIYATVNGKEAGKPRISPYKNNDINQGFDDAKVDAWVAFAVYWCSLSERNMLHLLLSEKETHFLYTDAQRKQAMAYLAQKFAPVAGRIIWDREEFPTGQTAQAQNLYAYMRSVDAVNILAMHNNTNENPWSGFYNSTLIQLLSFQEWVGNFNSRIRNEVLKFPAGVTGYASEVTGGFQPNDVSKAEQLWNAGSPYNAGVGVYIACCDQRDTHDGWYQAYEPVYVRLAQLNGNAPPPDDTVVVPPPTTYALYFSTTSALNGIALNGATVPVGKIWAYINTTTDIPNRPLAFYLDNVFINNESGRPYELNGGNGQNIISGNHTVKVLNSQGQQISIATFSAGTVNPPDTTGNDTTSTSAIVLEYTTQWNKTNATIVQGNSITINSTSYWFFVRTSTAAPLRFVLRKNGAVDVDNSDSTPMFDMMPNGNKWFQRGAQYSLTVTNDAGGEKIVNITVQ